MFWSASCSLFSWVFFPTQKMCCHVLETTKLCLNLNVFYWFSPFIHSYISVLNVVCFMWGLVGETRLALVENKTTKEVMMLVCVTLSSNQSGFVKHILFSSVSFSILCFLLHCVCLFFRVDKVIFCNFTWKKYFWKERGKKILLGDTCTGGFSYSDWLDHCSGWS